MSRTVNALSVASMRTPCLVVVVVLISATTAEITRVWHGASVGGLQAEATDVRSLQSLETGSQVSPAQGSGQGGRDYQSRFTRRLVKIIEERR